MKECNYIDQRRKKELLERLELLNKVLPIVGALFIVLTGLNTIYKFNYYQIDFDYFDYDLKNSFILFSAHIFTWVSFLFLPKVIELTIKKVHIALKTILQTMLFVLTGMFILMIPGNTILGIFIIYRVHAYFLILIGAILLTGLFDLYFREFIGKNRNSAITKKLMLHNCIDSILAFCAQALLLLFLLISLFDLTGMTYEIKTQYQTVSIDGREKIVLFQTNNKIYVADYCEKDGYATIYTHDFGIYPTEGRHLSKVQFKKATVEGQKEREPECKEPKHDSLE